MGVFRVLLPPHSMGIGNSHSITVQLAWPFARAVRRSGVDEPFVVSGLDATFGWTRVSWETMAKGLAISEAAFGSGDLGIQAAKVVQPADFGEMMRCVQAQQTLGDAIRVNDRYYNLIATGVIIEMVRGETNTVRWLRPAPGPVITPTMVEFAFGLWIVVTRYIIGRPNAAVVDVTFRHAPPANVEPYRQLFGCTVRFNQPDDSITFASSMLDLPSVHADRYEAQAFEEKLIEIERSLPTATARDWVSQQVLLNLSKGPPAAEVVAKRFGVGTRQLHRRLRDEGTSYRGVVDDLRKHLALDYLQQSNLSMAEVASRLGFASVHAFHRAFRRLTGMTPSAARKDAASTPL